MHHITFIKQERYIFNLWFLEQKVKKLIRNSLHQIESCNGRLLGMVLNRVKINQHVYYKYYGEYK